MKRKILLSVMLLLILGFSAMQSCKKDEVVTPSEYVAAMPDAPTPAVDQIIPFTGSGQTINLTWTGTATEAIKWDVYFGDSESPELVASNVTANSQTVSVTQGGTYYWGVVTTDERNMESASELWSFQVNSNPGVANSPVPALDAVNISCNPRIAWAVSDPENDELTYDLYLGTSATPAVNQTALHDTTFTVTSTLLPNTAYYWKVVTHDPYGGESTSPVWKFTTGALPIAAFVGNYNCDEPAEAYSYNVSFTAPTSSTVRTANYWNSGWVGVFTVNFTTLTYTMPLTTFATGWTGVESGIIEPATGKMVGTYTIWHNGAIAEQGVHTYTKL